MNNSYLGMKFEKVENSKEKMGIAKCRSMLLNYFYDHYESKVSFEDIETVMHSIVLKTCYSTHSMHVKYGQNIIYYNPELLYMCDSNFTQLILHESIHLLTFYKNVTNEKMQMKSEEAYIYLKKNTFLEEGIVENLVEDILNFSNELYLINTNRWYNRSYQIVKKSPNRLAILSSHFSELNAKNVKKKLDIGIIEAFLLERQFRNECMNSSNVKISKLWLEESI